jgi:hypothetical protein
MIALILFLLIVVAVYTLSTTENNPKAGKCDFQNRKVHFAKLPKKEIVFQKWK